MRTKGYPADGLDTQLEGQNGALAGRANINFEGWICIGRHRLRTLIRIYPDGAIEAVRGAFRLTFGDYWRVNH